MSIMRPMSSSSIVRVIAVFLSTGVDESLSGILARTFRGVFANNAFEWVERPWLRQSSEKSHPKVILSRTVLTVF
jgi:hypothetical protein